MIGDYKYKAFISYSHTDHKWTRWLHKRLETYPIPKNIIGKVTPLGLIPRRLKPIFRDREDLSASHNLGEKIEAALVASENLIIICSPAAAKSKWVNQEILTFKRHNRGAQLFSIIIDGEPYASAMPGREDEECFPPALRYEVNPDGSLSDRRAEPIAADMRAHADGKRLGFLKLISGMIGVDLDEVVQRDMHRSRKRVTAITFGALLTVLTLSTMTLIATQSRNEAQAQRAEAEGLVEYMLTDLRAEIRGSVGELKVMTGLNTRLMEYFENQSDLTRLPASSLELRARIIGAMGEDDQNRGDLKQAQRRYKNLHQVTAQLLKEQPDNPDRLFMHAKSENRLGLVAHSIGNLEDALPRLDKARQLLLKIPASKRDPKKWTQLLAYVHANSCAALLKSKSDANEALQHCQAAVDYNETVIKSMPDNLNSIYGLVFNSLWLSEAYKAAGNINAANETAEKAVKLSDDLVKGDPENMLWREQQMEVYKTFAAELERQGRADAAIEFYDRALKISALLISTDADNITWMQHHNDLKTTLGKVKQ